MDLNGFCSLTNKIYQKYCIYATPNFTLKSEQRNKEIGRTTRT